MALNLDPRRRFAPRGHPDPAGRRGIRREFPEQAQDKARVELDRRRNSKSWAAGASKSSRARSGAVGRRREQEQ